MLRILLGASAAFAAFVAILAKSAEAHRFYPPYYRHDYSLGVGSGEGLQSAFALAVMYPGFVALMTMASFYFLRVLEPHIRHDHPALIKSAVALSGIWLVGFYPFLSSVLGGFLFCVTSVACIGGWLVVRRFGVQAKAWEMGVVFWAFFFFSLVLSLVVTGNGDALSSFINQPWQINRHFIRDAGPLLLIVLNIVIVVVALRKAGWKLPRPSAESSSAIKLLRLAVAVILLDFIIIHTKYALMGIVPLLMLASLPSLAYFGVYWLVMRLPEKVRGHVSLALFILLAFFLTLLAWLLSGLPVLALAAALSALGFVASLCGALLLAMRARISVSLKQLALFAAAGVPAGAAYVLHVLMAQTPAVQQAYVRDALLPLATSGGAAALALLVCLAGVGLFISPGTPAKTRWLAAGFLTSLLLLAHVGLEYARPAAEGAALDARLKRPAPPVQIKIYKPERPFVSPPEKPRDDWEYRYR